MKFSLFATVASAVFTAVAADRSIVVKYNNGVSSYVVGEPCYTDPSIGSCSPAELDLTYAIIYASGLNSTYGVQRSLRKNKMDDQDEMTESMIKAEAQKSRDLGYPTKCKNLCSGVATGYCQAVDCKGYRRRELVGDQDKRDLISGVSFTCTQQVNYINTELNRLVNQSLVSDSCKTFLSRPRDITCFDDYLYGVIDGFELWQTYLLDSISDNYSICYNRMYAFKTIANDCVHSVRTTLTGPNNYFRENTQQSPPYSVFGDWGTDGLNYETLPYTGNYTLRAVPDGFVEKTKNVTFQVVASKVLGVSLYDAVLKRMNTTNFVSGNRVCIGRSFSWEFNIDDCSSSNRATLTGPSGFTMRESKESLRPFTMYGRSNYVMIGKTLTTIGNYTLTIYPGQIVSEGVKVIRFAAVKC